MISFMHYLITKLLRTISYYLVDLLLPVASSTPKRKSSAPVKKPPSKKTKVKFKADGC